MSVRVRYAPSPTGLQHIGGIRSALFNYFFARSEGGTFILRIEDTDQTRSNQESIQDLYDSLEWLGITWDEGPKAGGPHAPYVQSERSELYRRYAEKLLDEGRAYRCYCSSERLEKMREEQEGGKKGSGYDRKCRNLSEEERKKLEESGQPSVVRLEVPLEGKTTFEDRLLGSIKRKNEDINPDPILLKSDGLPTYHLANVVDDHTMEITHVMRAQEWLSSTPLHMILYDAFGWDPPEFCHLPLVMGKDGSKLSKRHGSTSIRDFREAGYLPEAILNYISLLGWSYDDQREFFTREELERMFSIDKLNKAPAVFDYKKLTWFNGQYIRMRDDESLEKLILPYLQKVGLVDDPPTGEQREIIDGMMPLVRERLKLLPDIADLVRFLFTDIGGFDPADAIPKKSDAETTVKLLEIGRSILEGFDGKSNEETEEEFREAAEKNGAKLGAMLMPIRVAVTGSTASPPLFGSIRVLGTKTTLERIDDLIRRLREKL